MKIITQNIQIFDLFTIKKKHCYTIYLMPFLQHDDNLKQVLKFVSRMSLVAITFSGTWILDHFDP